jgi:hypothetical protein
MINFKDKDQSINQMIILIRTTQSYHKFSKKLLKLLSKIKFKA